MLLQLLQALVERCGSSLATHLPEIVQVLCTGFGDAFPDAKKTACTTAAAIAAALPSAIEPHVATLVGGLGPALAHQHSRVRGIGTEALFALLLREPSLLAEVAPQLALISVDRSPAVREQAVHALAELLSRLSARRQHAARLLPLLLSALSDEVESIRVQAGLAMQRLGDLFAADEEAAPPLDDEMSPTDVETTKDITDAKAMAEGKAMAKSNGPNSTAAAAAAAAAPPCRTPPPAPPALLRHRSASPAAAALVASSSNRFCARPLRFGGLDGQVAIAQPTLRRYAVVCRPAATSTSTRSSYRS